MRAYILDRDTLATLGLVGEASTRLTLKRRFWGVDTIELVANWRQAPNLEAGRLLFVPDPSGGDQLVYLVDTLEIDQSGSAANYTMTANGSSIEGLPRLCLPTAGMAYDSQTSVAAETAMKHYVGDNMGPAAAAARIVPGLACAADIARGAVISKDARYQNLVDLLAEIGQAGALGWKTTLATTLGLPSGFTFDVIAGTDRSASVFFDFSFETLASWTELTNLSGSISLALVAGQGLGAARDIVTRPAVEPTGFDRREAFVDARDVTVGDTTLLGRRGDDVLAANAGQFSLEANVSAYGSFRYGVDWFLGDIVTVRNKERGLSYPARIVEVDETVQSSVVPEVVAILGRPFPTSPAGLISTSELA
jgi:hypothetical protein